MFLNSKVQSFPQVKLLLMHLATAQCHAADLFPPLGSLLTRRSDLKLLRQSWLYHNSLAVSLAADF